MKIQPSSEGFFFVYIFLGVMACDCFAALILSSTLYAFRYHWRRDSRWDRLGILSSQALTSVSVTGMISGKRGRDTGFMGYFCDRAKFIQYRT